jgi:hypothetical protein
LTFEPKISSSHKSSPHFDTKSKSVRRFCDELRWLQKTEKRKPRSRPKQPNYFSESCCGRSKTSRKVKKVGVKKFPFRRKFKHRQNFVRDEEQYSYFKAEIKLIAETNTFYSKRLESRQFFTNPLLDWIWKICSKKIQNKPSKNFFRKLNS